MLSIANPNNNKFKIIELLHFKKKIVEEFRFSSNKIYQVIDDPVQTRLLEFVLIFFDNGQILIIAKAEARDTIVSSRTTDCAFNVVSKYVSSDTDKLMELLIIFISLFRNPSRHASNIQKIDN